MLSEDGPILENYNGDRPLIITENVGTSYIHRLYIDGGSSAEIMYELCFEQLKSEERKEMLPPTATLVGFFGKISWPPGLITFKITIYDNRGHLIQTIIVDFIIIRAPSQYYIILGRPGLRKLGAIPSTFHSLMKF